MQRWGESDEGDRIVLNGGDEEKAGGLVWSRTP